MPGMNIFGRTPASRFLWLFILSGLPLLAALTGQLAFGLQPCELCLLERIPFALVAMVSLVLLTVLMFPALRPLASRRMQGLALALVLVAVAGNMVLALFHVGVEHSLWASPVCSGGIQSDVTVADLQAALDGPVRPSCSDVQWTLAGISLAGYNALYCLAFSLLAGYWLRRPPVGLR